MISIPRRRLVLAAAALQIAPGAAFAQSAPLTPACGKPTAAQTAGPFFMPKSPQRSSLVEKGARDGLVLSGAVVSAQCSPVANALLDFWHADESGDYDNKGYRYRGHLFTDAQGRFRLETIVPAEYPGRARHIHVNVQPPGGRILTTQLYFPGEPGNARDSLYRRDLTVRVTGKDTGKSARVQAEYDFVVAA